MAQLTIPGRYNVMGGTLEGFPFIGIGFNLHLAWTHTVSTTRRFTIFQLSLVPGDPTSYLVDGKPERMGRVTVRVNTGQGISSHTFYTTRWGLVLDVPAAHYTWTTSTAYALGDSVAGDLARAANQYVRMGQATSVRDLLAVEERYLAIPTFNTIAADDRGQTLYGDIGNTPNVTSAKIRTCTPSGLPQLVYAQARVITLDGSRSACGWANDPGTPVAGIFERLTRFQHHRQRLRRELQRLLLAGSSDCAADRVLADHRPHRHGPGPAHAAGQRADRRAHGRH